MKKIFTLFISLLMVGIVVADGVKPLTKTSTSTTPLLMKPLSLSSTTYAPDPKSGKVGNAFNIYVGLGSLHGSNLGISIGGDFEFPVIDPNLTLGPQFGFGMHHYGNPYFDNNGIYHSGTSQISLSGGVIARYYADWLIPNMPEQFDVFITSNVGFNYIMYTSYYSNKAYFDWGTSLGGRWNFSEKMSVYAQVGYGANNILVGLSLKM